MAVILKGQLEFLTNEFEVLGVCSPTMHYFEELKRNNEIKIVGIPLSRKIDIISDLRSIWSLFRLFLSEKPEIIHTQTPKAGLLGMVAAFFARVPVRIHGVTGMPFQEAKGIKAKLLYTTEFITYWCSSHIIPNSFGLKTFITENFPSSRRKISMIGFGSSNGINCHYFSPNSVSEELKNRLRNDCQIEPSQFVFSFVGRIVKDKGIQELLDAFLLLSRNNPNIMLLVIGPHRSEDDPLDDDYFQILNNHKQIRYVGLQKDIRPYLSISDVFVFPSYREGLPGAIMQAFAMSLPVISTNIIGSNELIFPNETGLLVEVKNSQALYEAMNEFYLNRYNLEKMGRKGREIMIQRYSQPEFHLNLVRFYKQCIEEYNV